MATINTSVQNPSILDFLSRTDPETKKIAMIAEMLSQSNEILGDMTMQEGNLPTGNRVTIRTGLPEATWRMYNRGVPTGKSRTAQVDDITGMLEAYSEVDKALADLNGNTPEFRASEDIAHLEGMNQEMASTLFYGGYGDLLKFVGLSARYSSLSTDPLESGYNVINGGGSGSDNTSIWFVTWSPETTFGIFPKGSQAGFNHTDKGQVTILDDDGNQYEGYRSHYKWDIGLSVKDWRFNARVANIDVSDLSPTAETGADLIAKMIEAYYRIPYRATARRFIIYCNATISEYLHLQAREKSNVNLTLREVEGMPIVSFLGADIKRCDAILNTESTVA